MDIWSGLARISYRAGLSVDRAVSCAQFAELETLLGDVERARAIYELAINQPRLDMPEILWKSYIDFETEQEEFDRTRQLYERLLERTQHVKASQMASARVTQCRERVERRGRSPVTGVYRACAVQHTARDGG